MGNQGLLSGSTIVSNPVKVVPTNSNRFGSSGWTDSWFIVLGSTNRFEPLIRPVEPIRLEKWEIRVYCLRFNYRFKSGQKMVRTYSNRFVASPSSSCRNGKIKVIIALLMNVAVCISFFAFFSKYV